jgi:hypothetical protein
VAGRPSDAGRNDPLGSLAVSAARPAGRPEAH